MLKAGRKKQSETNISNNYKDNKAALLFLLPSILGISIFFLFPFIDTIRRSFFDVVGNTFTGLQNYISVINNESFRLASYNTVRFILICIPLLLTVSLILALLMHAIRPGGRRFKTLFLMPMAIPAASLVLFWKLLFSQYGIVNAFLDSIGLDSIGFLNSESAFWVLVGTYVWKNCGYDMVLWLAGLDGISESLYEAAKVDGAGSVRCFISITLPSLAPHLSMITILSLLNSFKVFREAYLISGSYPHSSMYLLQHLFNNWFENMDISRLCSAAFLLSVFLFSLIAVMHRVMRQKEA